MFEARKHLAYMFLTVTMRKMKKRLVVLMYLYTYSTEPLKFHIATKEEEEAANTFQATSP